MERFAKKIRPECRCATRNFSGKGWGRFVELGRFDIDFVKNTRKEARQGKILESFLLDTFKTPFLTENVTQRQTQSESFFQKSGHFF